MHIYQENLLKLSVIRCFFFNLNYWSRTKHLCTEKCENSAADVMSKKYISRVCMWYVVCARHLPNWITSLPFFKGIRHDSICGIYLLTGLALAVIRWSAGVSLHNEVSDKKEEGQKLPEVGGGGDPCGANTKKRKSLYLHTGETLERWYICTRIATCFML